MAVVDVMMLGRLGKGHLAALSVGNAFFNIPWFFIEGFLTAQDTLGANAHGAGDAASVRQWSYIALGLVLALCLVASVAFLFAEPILGQLFWVSYHLKTKAAVHIYLLLPGMWSLSVSRVLQKVRPPFPPFPFSLFLSPPLSPFFSPHSLFPPTPPRRAVLAGAEQDAALAPGRPRGQPRQHRLQLPLHLRPAVGLRRLRPRHHLRSPLVAEFPMHLHYEIARLGGYKEGSQGGRD